MIKLEQIGKTYKNGAMSYEALKNVDLSIADGEYIVITGASGSGKTTLLNLIGCLDTPTAGRYLLNDKPIESYGSGKLSALRNTYFGFVLQDFALLRNETALFNVMMPLLIQNKKTAEIKEIAKNALASVGLSGMENKKAIHLSGGQQQRVAIARALATNASVIIADEPTGQLDSATGKEIMELLSELHKSGKTIIVATHNPLIRAYADREIRLSDGRIV